MTGPGNFKDSLHWTHTERLRRGAAVSSIDVRRLAAKAAWRERRRRWKRAGGALVARLLMRFRHRLMRWRARIERARVNANAGQAERQAGRAGQSDTATPTVGTSAVAGKTPTAARQALGSAPRG